MGNQMSYLVICTSKKTNLVCDNKSFAYYTVIKADEEENYDIQHIIYEFKSPINDDVNFKIEIIKQLLQLESKNTVTDRQVIIFSMQMITCGIAIDKILLHYFHEIAIFADIALVLQIDLTCDKNSLFKEYDIISAFYKYCLEYHIETVDQQQFKLIYDKYMPFYNEYILSLLYTCINGYYCGTQCNYLINGKIVSSYQNEQNKLQVFNREINFVMEVYTPFTSFEVFMPGDIVEILPSSWEKSIIKPPTHTPCFGFLIEKSNRSVLGTRQGDKSWIFKFVTGELISIKEKHISLITRGIQQYIIDDLYSLGIEWSTNPGLTYDYKETQFYTCLGMKNMFKGHYLTPRLIPIKSKQIQDILSCKDPYNTSFVVSSNELIPRNKRFIPLEIIEQILESFDLSKIIAHYIPCSEQILQQCSSCDSLSLMNNAFQCQHHLCITCVVAMTTKYELKVDTIINKPFHFCPICKASKIVDRIRTYDVIVNQYYSTHGYDGIYKISGFCAFRNCCKIIEKSIDGLCHAAGEQHNAVENNYIDYCDEHSGDNPVTCQERECPKCNTMIAKNGGCDHITCSCGWHFCVRCNHPGADNSATIYTHMRICSYTDSNGIYHEGGYNMT